MYLFPTTLAFLALFYANAQPANHGDVLSCRTAETGAKANQTLVSNGLPPPNKPDLLVGFYCEPLAPAWPCHKPFPQWLKCNFPHCLCCGEEEMIERFTGYVGVDCVSVLGT